MEIKRIFYLIMSTCSLLILGACSDNVESSSIDDNVAEVTEERSTEEKTINEDEIQKGNQETKDEEKKDSIDTSLTIVLNDVVPYDPNIHDVYSYEVNFPLTFINHTNKDIEGFTAITYFYDIFDELLMELDLKYDYGTINANNSIDWVAAYDINQFKEEDMRFYSVPFENIKFNYEITSIIFSDGTKLTME